MFRLLSRSSSGLFSRMLEIQTNMLKCISEPHDFFWIPNILVMYLDDDLDSNRNILVKEHKVIKISLKCVIVGVN